jgi:hypothetical protein
MKNKEGMCTLVFLGHGAKTGSALIVKADKKKTEIAIDFPIQVVLMIKNPEFGENYFVRHLN